MTNIAVIQGRLAADPQLNRTISGKSVCSFRVACDRGRKDDNGQSQVDWLDVVAWEKTAEFICSHFTKGKMILIEGRVQSRNYQDKNGNNRTATEVVARTVNFCGSRKEDAQAAQTPAAKDYEAEDYSAIADDGDLPF